MLQENEVTRAKRLGIVEQICIVLAKHYPPNKANGNGGMTADPRFEHCVEELAALFTGTPISRDRDDLGYEQRKASYESKHGKGSWKD